MRANHLHIQQRPQKFLAWIRENNQEQPNADQWEAGIAPTKGAAYTLM